MSLIDNFFDNPFSVIGDVAGEVIGAFASRGSGGGGGGGSAGGGSSASIAKSLLDASKTNLKWQQFHKAVDMSGLGHMPPPEARQASYFREIQEVMSRVVYTQLRRAIVQQLARSGMSAANILQYAKNNAGLGEVAPRGTTIPLEKGSSKTV